MGYRANYSGPCSACTEGVKKGQLITWSRKGAKQVRHADCSNPDAEGTEKEKAIPEPFYKKGEEYDPPEPPDSEEEEPEEEAEEEESPEDERKPLELAVEEAPARKTATEHVASEQKVLDELAAVLKEKIGATGGVDEGRVTQIVNRLLSEREPLTVKVERGEGAPPVVIENVHFHFPNLLYLVSKRHHVYMYGPPGSGKSTAAKQASESLEIPFGYISLNPMTPDSRLLGFMDANGKYRETVFRKLYENGGVFCIDELDNASPSLLTTLNSMLENGIGAFPDGMVTKHGNFVMVATGNTAGRGANPMFPERRPFDSAFAERFKYIAWGYDEKLERNVALGINPEAGKWVDWVQNVRRWALANLPRLVVSPRASFFLADYTKDGQLTPIVILDMVLWKGFDPESVGKAIAANPLPR